MPSKPITLWSDGYVVFIVGDAPADMVMKRITFHVGERTFRGTVTDTLCPCCKQITGFYRYRVGKGYGLGPGRTQATYEVEDLGGI